MSRRPNSRGSAALETALWLPILLLFLVGMVQLGKITYVYYTLKKTLYGVATYVASQQSVDFCDDGNPIATAAKSLGLTGGPEGFGEPLIPTLTADMIRIDIECVDPASGEVGSCSTAGCDGAMGSPRPDFVIVSIPDGFPVQPRIPYMLMDPIALRPQVRVPFGGT